MRATVTLYSKYGQTLHFFKHYPLADIVSCQTMTTLITVLKWSNNAQSDLAIIAEYLHIQFKTEQKVRCSLRTWLGACRSE